MHKGSYRLMEQLRGCIKPGSSVLDVGGADVNGSYRPLFEDCKYTSLDYQNADIVVTGYEWPIADDVFDAVVSGQTLEHDGWFWVTLQNIARVLKPGGHAIIIAPSKGEVHRYPVDCYRFLPDSMDALARWAKLTLLEMHSDKEGKWRDIGAVFRKPNS
jgi:SAM-dependent methyltransferase